MNYFKAKGQFHEEGPQPGDLIFYWNSDKTEASHVGIVEKTSWLYVYTIEGNTTGSSTVEHGGMVNTHKYKLSADRIIGYGRPDWANIDPGVGLSEEIETETTKETDIMKIGTAMVVPKTGTAVNFRVKPSKTAGRVTGCKQIPGNEIVDVLSIDGDWAQIEYNGYVGYMMTEFLAMEGSDDGETEATDRSVDEIVAEITKLVQELAAKAC